jgi:hypothetical protein
MPWWAMGCVGAFNSSNAGPAVGSFPAGSATALYRLRDPAYNVARILTALNLGLSVAEVQVLIGHSDATLLTWLTRARRHAEKVHPHFFRHLSLGHLQVAELCTTLRNKAYALRA